MGIRAATETKLLDAADELFFARGIAATTVDEVLARAGVSPATLYRGYESKEALVAAALDRRQRDWLAVWDSAVERVETPREKLLAVFDALDEFRARPNGARWCAFLGSAAEYADPPEEIRAAVSSDTEAFRSRLTELARPLVGNNAEVLAEKLLLVISGELAMRLRGAERGTEVARAVAAALMPES